MDSEEMRNRILKQVEYYFSDENLIRGKHLKQLIKKCEDGWVHLNQLVKFKRLARITDDAQLIGKLLLQTNSNVIEISKDKQRIRRINNTPPPNKNRENVNQMISRSAYVEGFEKHLDHGFLINFFDEATNVIIRKYYDKASGTYKSKGSAFVTFATSEQCDEFVEKKLTLNGVPLEIMHQKQFVEQQKGLRRRKN